VFSLGTLPDDAKGLRRAQDLAARLNTVLAGTRVPYGQAGHALGVHPNSLRYAAATGTVLIRWDGARQPEIWTVPPPETDPGDARLDLAAIKAPESSRSSSASSSTMPPRQVLTSTQPGCSQLKSSRE